MKTKNYVGTVIALTPGTTVHTAGHNTKQKRYSTVTVRAQETTPKGKTRVVWYRMGLRASTILN